jgi:XrtN system VIT domain protein
MLSLKGKKVYVYENGLRLLNESNKYRLFETLHEQGFSLFPLYEISETANTLLVTKNNPVSPNLDDLTGSVFMKDLQEFLARKQKIRLFNLGADLSPYLKSLKEMRVFSYEHGSLQLLGQLVTLNSFAEDAENDDHVIIHDAGISIQREEGSAPSTAPDHLMRLFTYNHIMKELGAGVLSGPLTGEELVSLAQKACIVSPISSLVVLEKQEDYDRFNIKGADNSLENASMQSKGAVPEPHEWMLIIIAVLVLSYTVLYPRLKLRFP